MVRKRKSGRDKGRPNKIRTGLRPGRAGISDSRPLDKPIPGPQAFTNLVEPTHVHSQAATLLLIGFHLRGDAAAIGARAQAAREFMQLRPDGVAETLPRDDVVELGFPRMQTSAARFLPSALENAAGLRFTARPAPLPVRADVGAASGRLVGVANAFYQNANPETAATLLEVSLRHPNQLVRVAAAASYVEIVADPVRSTLILEHGVRSGDRMVRAVAAHALAHVDPRNRVLASLLSSNKRPSLRRPSRTSAIVHGTWARASSWWQPDTGEFWKYLHDNVDPDLYGAADRFEWSGGYSDVARALAGNDFREWVGHKAFDGLDLFTHSHGGSVAMLASQGGTRVGKLVMLSCPVHWPKYAPNFTQVSKVVSVRVRMDLVILADRGGQRFQDNHIDEHVLPIWFDHFATHDPHTWDRYRVRSML